MFNDDNMENDDTEKVLYKTSQNGIKIRNANEISVLKWCSHARNVTNSKMTYQHNFSAQCIRNHLCARYQFRLMRCGCVDAVLTTHSIFQIKTNKLHKRDDRPKIKQRNLSINVCSLEMQTPRAIRVTHSYNKYSAIFECQAFCTSAKRAHSVLLNSLVVFGKFLIFIFGTYFFGKCALLTA